jgi:hypothetical protein
MSITLDDFAKDLQQDILASADVQDSEDFAENAFTRRMLDYVAEAGELGDADVCHFSAHGVKVNGYELNLEEESLDLAIAIYTGQCPPSRIEKSRVDTAIRQLTSFLKRAVQGLHAKIEESHPAFALAQPIHDFCAKGERFSRIRLFVITDGIVNVDRLPEPEKTDAGEASIQIWDIERLHRWYTSGHELEEIEIDFAKGDRGSIPCIPVREDGADYESYLAAIPAETLVSIYSRYGPRLLERNVRSFLQLKGEINKGIRKTILENPERFLAYNNGITVTAAEVRLIESEHGSPAIAYVRDLQIVNGGQTTASLFRAVRKDDAAVEAIYVPMKLSVVKDPAHLDGFVADISRYANSQNKVSLADLSANDPFHRRMEELSRTIWAPAAAGSQRQTRWFYERARGQYSDARAREGTPSRIRTFEQIHPRAQMFTKTDLAKYENTWMQRPHVVSKGAQKSFLAFTEELSRRGGFNADERYFQHLIAKAILFKQAEKIVHKLAYGGYRANIVAYTLSWLSHATSQRVDLQRIWSNQGLTPATAEAIENVSKHVHGLITSPPGGRNVTEWCKSEACWHACSELSIELPKAVLAELIPIDRTAPHPNVDLSQPDEHDLEKIDRAKKISAEMWFRLSKWAKETGNLMPWQRSLAFSLGKIASRAGTPSRKQAEQGLRIVEEATRLGFK